MKTIKIVLVLVFLAAFAALIWSVCYPERSRETKESLEAIGAVGLENVLSSMEERVGKANVALEHYKTALKAQRESLVSLKAMKRDCERKAEEAAEKAASFEAVGNASGSAAQKKKQVMFAAEAEKLTGSIAKLEARYRDANNTYERKKIELAALSDKATMLRAELTAMGGEAAAHALKKARELEEEIKSECSRIEAEMDVQALDEEIKG